MKTPRRPVETPRFEHGSFELLRVSLDEELEPHGQVTATVTMPSNPEDPDSEDPEDYWRLTTVKVFKVRHGVPTTETVPAGAIAWVVNYGGRWCVIQHECADEI